jgi:hypothetical protein
MDQPRRRGKRLGPKRFGASQLEWVARNRQAPEKSWFAGVEVRRQDIAGSGRRRFAREVYDAINAVVDEAFRANCLFDDVHAGAVRILVNPPEALYNLRSTWQALLERQLAQTCRQGTVHRVEFVPLSEDDADRPERPGAYFTSS